MSKDDRLRVLVAEDDPMVRDYLAELIESERAFEYVGGAVDATEAVALAATVKPDVVIVDVRMPGGGGVTAARGIARRSPDSKLIALSGQGDRATVLQMLEAGAVGYLLKTCPAREIVDAIKGAPEGHGSLSIEVAGGIIDELAGELTVRTRTRKKHEASERRIRRALEGDSALAMVYQPIVELSDGTIVGAEALARFQGPPIRPPSLWFAEAASVALREELELLAARRAIEALPELPDDAFLSINVSPTTLMTKELLDLAAGSDAGRLVAEITEHAPIHDYAELDESLGRLRALGLRLAIDDAGAGYSSLRHILELRPDLIKLDITLIRNIDRDSAKQALAAGLISFAHKSGASIVAEGIEHEQEAETLVELGTNFGQGHYLAVPAPLPLARPSRRPGKRLTASAIRLG